MITRDDADGWMYDAIYNDELTTYYGDDIFIRTTRAN